MRRLFVALIALGVWATSFGAEVTCRNFLRGTDVSNGAVLRLQEQQFDFIRNNPTTWQDSFEDESVKNVVSLRLDRPLLKDKVSFEVVADLTIAYDQWDNGTASFVPVVVNTTLTVDYNDAGGVTHLDEDVFTFERGYNVTVTVNAVTVTGDVAGGEAVILDSRIDVERFFVFDTGLSPVPGHQVLADEIEVYWNDVPGAEDYELEWVYINDYEGTGAPGAPVFLPANGLNIDFKHNSTRIQTKKNYWRISNLFEHGYVAYRIRAIGLQGDDHCIRHEGVWSHADLGVVTDFPFMQVNTLDDAVNWSYQASYTESGRRFEGISYMDGLGYNRQSQTRNNTEQEAIVQETYYDHQGRPAVTALPVPVEANNLKYKENFNRSISGEHYDREDFDVDDPLAPDGCSSTPTGIMSDQSGAGQYYSDQNPEVDGKHSAIPDANDFPLVRIEYMPDNTGRIRKQGMAGDTYQLDGDHSVNYEYGTPTQEKINELFGTDVGLNEKYQRNTIEDQNGQKSVSYVDASGRIIASALAGAEPPGLDALNSNTGPSLVSTNIMSGGSAQDDSQFGTLTYAKTFTVESAGAHAFKYSITPEQFTDAACLPTGICFDCVYDVTIVLTDIGCGGPPLLSETRTINGFPFDNSCAAPLGFEIDFPELTLNLAEGTYTISKTLTVNQEALDYYTTEYLNNSTCLLTYQDFYNTYLADVDFVGCGITACEVDCYTQNGTLEDFIAGGGTEAGYNALIASCVSDCEDNPEDHCESFRIAMLTDLSPGGQYGLFDAVTFTSNDPLSIYNEVNNQLPESQQNPGIVSWRTPDPAMPYTNDDGTPAQIMNSFGVMVNPEHPSISLEEFIQNFQLSWAASLLIYHPEHCYYKYCINNDPSHEYDQAMLDTDSYDDALAAGLLNPLGMEGPGVCAPNNTTNEDPLFASWDSFFQFCEGIKPVFDPVSDQQLVNKLTNYVIVEQNPYTIWEVAYWLTYCPEATTAAEIDACLGGDLCNALFGQDQCTKDILWATFRSLYLAAKQELYQAESDQFAIGKKCYNGCFGAGTNTFDVTNDNFDCFDDLSFGLTPNCDPPNDMDYDADVDPEQPCGTTTIALYADKVAHFGGFGAFPQFNGLTGNALLNALQADFDAFTVSFCADVCSTNVDGWMNDLVGCAAVLTGGETWTAGQPTFDNLYAELHEFCTLGCDDTHAGGATTLPVGATTTNGYSTIEQILDAYLPAGYESADCISYLINNPGPYNVVDQEAQQAPLDDCGCDLILATNDQFQNGVLPDGVNSVEDLLAYNHGIAADHLDPLICACNEAQTDPNYLANNVIEVPLGLTCSPCTDCATITPLYNTLLGETWVTSQAALEAHPNYTDILEGYFNGALSFSIAGEDYADFLEACEGNFTTPVCEISPFALEFEALLDELAQRGFVKDGIPTQNLTAYTEFTSTSLATVINGIDYFTCNDPDGTDVCDATTLTLHFGTANNDCEVELFIPAGQPAAVTWNNLIAVENIRMGPEVCPFNSGDFAITGIFRDGATLISVPMTGTSACFNFYDCVCSTGTLELCDEPFDLSASGNDCVESLLAQVETDAFSAYQDYLEEQAALFQEAYVDHCISAVGTESIDMQYQEYEYHFTLYYYDQAGNLVRTVPPEGVDGTFDPSNVDGNRGTVTSDVPAHTYNTEYRYNSFNNVIERSTPDGGTSVFFYDFAGRIAASQNAKQAGIGVNGTYSYTIYDEFGRVVEGGQVQPTAPLTDAIAKDPAALSSWVSTGVRTEVTKSFYDEPLDASIAAEFADGQNFLRLRIATTAYYETFSGNDLAYNHASHFSYDQHGNVVETIQDYPALKDLEHDKKRIKYEFELISGNVNKVKYQEGFADQYYHEYCYDPDNRIAEVRTSKDDCLYDLDARYIYYDHGPLARTEIGDWEVQGCDYAYTINGWLKTINGNVLSPDSEIGKDATVVAYSGTHNLHQCFGADANGFSLGYYDGDYQAVNPLVASAHGSLGNVSTTGYNSNLGNQLFNGNIRHMATALMDENEEDIPLNAAFYEYDQLHRIKRMRNYLGANYQFAGNTDQYSTDYSYDANGNLLTLKRYSQGTLMDDFTYQYDAGDNQLNSVIDNVSTPGIPDDIEGVNPYLYTQIGELEVDVTEGIQRIDWRLSDSKVRRVDRTGDHEQLEFEYDAFGNRVLKLTKPTVGGVPTTDQTQWTYTYYFRDAQGNVMAVYDLKWNTALSADYTLKENHMYGNKRCGIDKRDQLLTTATFGSKGGVTLINHVQDASHREMGNKFYELTNHLGNVLTVVSDRQLTRQEATVFEDFENSSINIAPSITPGFWSFAGGINQSFSTNSSGSNALTFEYTCNAFCGTNRAFSVEENEDYHISFELERDDPTATVTLVVQLGDGIGDNTLLIQDLNDGLNVFTINAGPDPNGDPVGSPPYIRLKWQLTPADNANLPITLKFDNFRVTGKGLQESIETMCSADVITFSDFYPFGLEMDGRSGGQNSDYRYSFNGMEKDDEWSGSKGYSLDFGARMYDSRLGRWRSKDPLDMKYPAISPYVYVANTPIAAIDPDGKKIVWAYGINQSDKKKIKDAIKLLRRKSPHFDHVYKTLQSSETVFAFATAVQEGGFGGFGSEKQSVKAESGDSYSAHVVNIDILDFDGVNDDESIPSDITSTVAEEMFHGFQMLTYGDDYLEYRETIFFELEAKIFKTLIPDYIGIMSYNKDKFIRSMKDPTAKEYRLDKDAYFQMIYYSDFLRDVIIWQRNYGSLDVATQAASDDLEAIRKKHNIPEGMTVTDRYNELYRDMGINLKHRGNYLGLQMVEKYESSMKALVSGPGPSRHRRTKQKTYNPSLRSGRND